MTTYNVFCDSCEAEYSVTPLEGGDNTVPSNCSYCGSTITEETISEKKWRMARRRLGKINRRRWMVIGRR